MKLRIKWSTIDYAGLAACFGLAMLAPTMSKFFAAAILCCFAFAVTELHRI